MVVLDTSIIIDHLRQPAGAETVLKRIIRTRAERNLALAVISVQELYAGASSRDQVRSEYIVATIAPLRILPYTYEVAELAGELMRDSRQPPTFADAAIAATAIVNDASLATLNTKDFRSIPDLKLYKLLRK